MTTDKCVGHSVDVRYVFDHYVHYRQVPGLGGHFLIN